MSDQPITQDEIDRLCRSLKLLEERHSIQTPYGMAFCATYGLASTVIQRLWSDVHQLEQKLDKATYTAKKQRNVLVNLRDEIIPHWSKHEAISVINEVLK